MGCDFMEVLLKIARDQIFEDHKLPLAPVQFWRMRDIHSPYLRQGCQQPAALQAGDVVGKPEKAMIFALISLTAQIGTDPQVIPVWRQHRNGVLTTPDFTPGPRQ
jgi:hypothetical protein